MDNNQHIPEFNPRVLPPPPVRVLNTVASTNADHPPHPSHQYAAPVSSVPKTYLPPGKHPILTLEDSENIRQQRVLQIEQSPEITSMPRSQCISPIINSSNVNVYGGQNYASPPFNRASTNFSPSRQYFPSNDNSKYYNVKPKKQYSPGQIAPNMKSKQQYVSSLGNVPNSNTPPPKRLYSSVIINSQKQNATPVSTKASSTVTSTNTTVVTTKFQYVSPTAKTRNFTVKCRMQQPSTHEDLESNYLRNMPECDSTSESFPKNNQCGKQNFPPQINSSNTIGSVQYDAPSVGTSNFYVNPRLQYDSMNMSSLNDSLPNRDGYDVPLESSQPRNTNINLSTNRQYLSSPWNTDNINKSHQQEYVFPNVNSTDDNFRLGQQGILKHENFPLLNSQSQYHASSPIPSQNIDRSAKITNTNFPRGQYYATSVSPESAQRQYQQLYDQPTSNSDYNGLYGSSTANLERLIKELYQQKYASQNQDMNNVNIHQQQHNWPNTSSENRTNELYQQQYAMPASNAESNINNLYQQQYAMPASNAESNINKLYQNQYCSPTADANNINRLYELGSVSPTQSSEYNNGLYNHLNDSSLGNADNINSAYYQKFVSPSENSQSTNGAYHHSYESPIMTAENLNRLYQRYLSLIGNSENTNESFQQPYASNAYSQRVNEPCQQQYTRPTSNLANMYQQQNVSSTGNSEKLNIPYAHQYVSPSPNLENINDLYQRYTSQNDNSNINNELYQQYGSPPTDSEPFNGNYQQRYNASNMTQHPLDPADQAAPFLRQKQAHLPAGVKDDPVASAFNSHIGGVNLGNEFDRTDPKKTSGTEQKISDSDIPEDIPVALRVFYKELKLWEKKTKTMKPGEFYPYKLFE